MRNRYEIPQLYRELADWWPILSRPEDYAEEADFYRRTILEIADTPIHTLLELGCGGGNNASHLKQQFRMTLTDISPGMLEVSRKLNPECEHALGDMREIRLGRIFDSVFVHDAITYMTSEKDLRKAIDTAFVHCRPGGVALFAPDCVKETFRSVTSHGGHDGDSRALRYLSWTWDPDPKDDTYICDMVYMLRDGQDRVRSIYDRHVMGSFRKDVWLRVIGEAGFRAQAVSFVHSELAPEATFVFVGTKPSPTISTFWPTIL